jgi:hypothetical protein
MRAVTTVLLKSLMNSRRLMGFTPVAENLPESLIRSSSESYAPRCSRISLLMSALGQKQTSHPVPVMSALPPKADIVQHGANVRFVPEAEVGNLKG